MRRARLFFCLFFGLSFGLNLVPLAQAQEAEPHKAPTVVVSIRPLYAWVAAVMKGVGTPQLLLKGAESPHTYALKPSDIDVLSQAKVVFWVGPDLEYFLIKPLSNLHPGVQQIALSQVQGVQLLPVSTKDDDDDGSVGELHKNYAENSYDPHMWLDPVNASYAVLKIMETLTQIDPKNAEIYRKNGEEYLARLAALSTDLTQILQPISHKPFIVFHNAYQYFDKRFNLNQVGSVTYNPSLGNAAKQLAAIEEKIKQSRISCLFSEPQLSDKIIKILAIDHQIRVGVLDPLGSTLPLTDHLYEQLLQNLAHSLRRCFEEQGR